MDYSWRDTWTGLTGIASAMTFGLVGIDGEPEGTTASQRRDIVAVAAGKTATQIGSDPSIVAKAGISAVLDGATGDLSDWFTGKKMLVWIGLGAWLYLGRSRR